ncbi:conserved protein of unknown function [Tenacibaculum sp. 190524A02b]|uniref:hypothetical protein n=1 Tax=Tenacibaculum vairaonense TaxID=3137860 RepID=UPI0032B14C26
MLNKRTLLEITHNIENWTTAELDRFALTFNIAIPDQINESPLSKAKKANIIFSVLDANNINGPFTDNIQIDSVQYILEKYIRENPIPEQNPPNLWGEVLEETPQDLNKLFIEHNSRLVNSIKRDGFTIRNEQIVTLLPEELIESNTENELIRLLNHFGFNTAKGHLEQAIENHTIGNWAGANGQFRTYLESLMIEICNNLIPARNCTNIGDAITWLSNSAILNPVLLHEHLNEVPKNGLNAPYINGLWKRLHPTGSHPGLSDEEDCTFRYHTLIVFTRYLLSRMENRN